MRKKKVAKIKQKNNSEYEIQEEVRGVIMEENSHEEDREGGEGRRK